MDRVGPIITAQTGWDESFIIGTKAELLQFAQSIIDSVNDAEMDGFFGERVKVSNLIYGRVGSSSEVMFDWVVVTKNNEQTLEISHKVLGL
jgi:hypothetical protein